MQSENRFLSAPLNFGGVARGRLPLAVRSDPVARVPPPGGAVLAACEEVALPDSHPAHPRGCGPGEAPPALHPFAAVAGGAELRPDPGQDMVGSATIPGGGSRLLNESPEDPDWQGVGVRA